MSLQIVSFIYFSLLYLLIFLAIILVIALIKVFLVKKEGYSLSSDYIENNIEQYRFKLP